MELKKTIDGYLLSVFPIVCCKESLKRLLCFHVGPQYQYHDSNTIKHRFNFN